MGHGWSFGVCEQWWGQHSLFLLTGDRCLARGYARVLILGDSQELQRGDLPFGERSASGTRHLGMEEPELKAIPGKSPGRRSPILASWLLLLQIMFLQARSLSRGLSSGTRWLRSLRVNPSQFYSAAHLSREGAGVSAPCPAGLPGPCGTHPALQAQRLISK